MRIDQKQLTSQIRSEDRRSQGFSDHEEGLQETILETPTSYQLVRDKERRQSRPIDRYGFSAYTDLLAYAFFTIVEIDKTELETYEQCSRN